MAWPITSATIRNGLVFVNKKCVYMQQLTCGVLQPLTPGGVSNDNISANEAELNRRLHLTSSPKGPDRDGRGPSRS